jgi:hypothetical protein
LVKHQTLQAEREAKRLRWQEEVDEFKRLAQRAEYERDARKQALTDAAGREAEAEQKLKLIKRRREVEVPPLTRGTNKQPGGPTALGADRGLRAAT